MKRFSTIRKRLLYLTSVCITAALVAVLAFIPFENLFITFDSAEKAYNYYTFGESGIDLVIEGKDSDFIVDRDEYSFSYLILPKTEDGWKIGIGSNTKKVVQKNYEDIRISVYQYKNTDDYYLVVTNVSGGQFNISDEYDTKFYSLNYTNDSLEKTFVIYYAHISDFNIQYCVEVNGNKIKLENT